MARHLLIDKTKTPPKYILDGVELTDVISVEVAEADPHYVLTIKLNADCITERTHGLETGGLKAGVLNGWPEGVGQVLSLMRQYRLETEAQKGGEVPMSHNGPRGACGASSEWDLTGHLIREMEQATAKDGQYDRDGNLYFPLDSFVIAQTMDALSRYRRFLTNCRAGAFADAAVPAGKRKRLSPSSTKRKEEAPCRRSI